MAEMLGYSEMSEMMPTYAHDFRGAPDVFLVRSSPCPSQPSTGRPGWHYPATSLKQSTGWWFQPL